jgi:hypothetical protein
MKAKTIGQAAAVLTVGWAVSASAGAISDTRLEVRTFENIPYISGGVGSDERDTLRAMTHGDNLQLSFALADGKYLGGAELNVKDNMGKEVLEAAADGPLHFAKLGSYTIHATTMGQTLTRNVSIPPKGQAQIYFTWKDDNHYRTASEHSVE